MGSVRLVIRPPYTRTSTSLATFGRTIDPVSRRKSDSEALDKYRWCTARRARTLPCVRGRYPFRGSEARNMYRGTCMECVRTVSLHSFYLPQLSAGRCSATSFILSTPYVRTCITCSKKMLLPPSHVDFTSVTGSKVWPEAFRNEWVARSFVGACLFCLSCGNRCVRMF